MAQSKFVSRKVVLIPYPARSLTPSPFIVNDAKLLSKDFNVEVINNELTSLRFWKSLLKCSYVFMWFPSRGYLPLALLAWLLGKKIICNLGGYETANNHDLNYGGARSLLNRSCLRVILHLSKQILAVSEYTAQELRNNISNRLSPFIVPNGINQIFYDTPSCTQDRDAKTILTIAQIDDQNGIIKGLDIIASIAEKMPDYQFTIIGTTDKESHLFQTLNGTPNITIVGPIEQRALITYYDKSHFYLQPSRIESFGVSIIEAAARGCVTITSSNGALKEFTPNQEGIVENTESAEAYCEKILQYKQSEHRIELAKVNQFQAIYRQQKLLSAFQKTDMMVVTKDELR